MQRRSFLKGLLGVLALPFAFSIVNRKVIQEEKNQQLVFPDHPIIPKVPIHFEANKVFIPVLKEQSFAVWTEDNEPPIVPYQKITEIQGWRDPNTDQFYIRYEDKDRVPPHLIGNFLKLI